MPSPIFRNSKTIRSDANQFARYPGTSQLYARMAMHAYSTRVVLALVVSITFLSGCAVKPEAGHGSPDYKEAYVPVKKNRHFNAQNQGFERMPPFGPRGNITMN